MVVVSQVPPAPLEVPGRPSTRPSRRPATVAQLVGRTLAGLGVGHVFGVVGSGNFEVTNALRLAGVPFTAARHEGGAATMADAYSRMSGRVGVGGRGCHLGIRDHGLARAGSAGAFSRFLVIRISQWCRPNICCLSEDYQTRTSIIDPRQRQSGRCSL